MQNIKRLRQYLTYYVDLYFQIKSEYMCVYLFVEICGCFGLIDSFDIYAFYDGGGVSRKYK